MGLLELFMTAVGLSMDAFSISLANGLREPEMRRGRMCVMAGIFAFARQEGLIVQASSYMFPPLRREIISCRCLTVRCAPPTTRP